MFAIVKSAGNEKGRVRSVHRSYNAAMKAQPQIYYAICAAPTGVKKGEIVPGLLEARCGMRR